MRFEIAVAFLAAWLLAWGAALTSAAASLSPVVPVGLDAYRMWEAWPRQRIGVRAYLRSTYDRRGGNEAADASHFLYQEADDFNVTLDVAGPGILYFARYNHWHGSPWHFEVDGRDFLILETSTADPLRPVPGSVFLPEAVLPNPLTWTWSVTKGADLMWVPIPFERSFRMAYSRTHYGTGYYVYHQFVPGARLSQPVHSWDGQTPPDPDVLDLIRRAGSDLLPPPGSAAASAVGLVDLSGQLALPTNGVRFLPGITKARGVVRALEFSVPREHAVAFGRARLRATWDDRQMPSIDAPMALFFGAGTLYNRDDREYLVKAFPVHVRFTADRVHLACYFPMPFFRSARFELRGNGESPVPDVHWRLRFEPLREPPSHVAYFHATYSDHPAPVRGHDLVLLDTRHTEGGGDWSGHLVGMSWIFSHRGVLPTLEGDPRFFFDDSQTPQAQGTGTEEWGGGGDYWGGGNMTLPFVGHPVGAPGPGAAPCQEDLIQSAYRFLLADLMPFGRNALIRLEHGGENQSTEHYEAVVHWYGAPHATLVLTDELDVGDRRSERTHRYVSPEASAPYELTSRYEWGVDTVEGREVFPTQTLRGRKTRGWSEFNLKLDRRNLGVMLRRTLDYSFPNQRARVFVADLRRGRPSAWQPAGVWYLAGANTCVYSNPEDELGATQHVVQTSNRRFRDDEFLLPLELTRGRSAIRVRLEFAPVQRPLFPGHPLPELAWSEIAYRAYCWVLPD